MTKSDMNSAIESKSRCWNEPMVWLITALPLSAVIGGVLTVWLATENADSLVAEAHIKEGLAVRQLADLDRKAEELGIGATLTAENGKLTVSLDGDIETPPKRLLLTLSHPTAPGHDMIVILEPDHESLVYSAAFATMPEGKRHLALSSGDNSWRITGDWEAPSSGSIQLAAGTRFSSTQP